MSNSIVEIIKNHAVATPEKRAVVDAKNSYTYSQYYEKIKAYALYLLDKGIEKGDNVLIKTAQNVEYMAALHAIHHIGAVAIPVEKTVKPERVNEIQSVVCAKAYIADKEFDGICTFLYKDFPENDERELEYLPSASDDSTILFTTGTTGKSKGILLSHSADVAVAGNVVGGTEQTENTVEIVPMPLNHSFSLRRYYANMVSGATTIFLDGVIFVKKFFDCFDVLGATACAMAPSALAIIFKLSGEKIAEYTDKIDYLQFGGSYMPEADKEKIRTLLPTARLYNFYGSTEAGCSCIIDFNKNRENPYNIGKATVNSIIKFVDESDREVVPDESNPARLITGGGMLMNEYYKEPQLTAETLKNGYIYSNDMGYFDTDGNIIMLGRMDDVIISGGQKISPLDVEEVANKYDGISECAVIGVDDAVMGQIPKIFVVAKENYDEGALIKFLSERLEAHQVPKAVAQISEIPKTFNGKPLKRELKRIHEEGGKK